MARLSKAETERRKGNLIRIEKARASIMEQFGKMLGKHLPAILKPDQETEATARISIRPDGSARLEFSYLASVNNGALFPLDDGQDTLLLETGKGATSRDEIA